jgi:hypothetical protein
LAAAAAVDAAVLAVAAADADINPLN